METALKTRERKFLRKTYGPTNEYGYCRMQTNREICNKFKSPYSVTVKHEHCNGALRYKPEVSWVRFQMVSSFWPHYGLGVELTTNRNEYKEYFLGGKGGRCTKLTKSPPSCAVSL